MENNNGSHFIFIFLDEHQAGICDVRAGWYVLDCTGDSFLQSIYLYQELNEADKQAWCTGHLTEHVWVLLAEVGLDVSSVKIEFSRENRRYEVEVVEQIAKCPNTIIAIQVTNASCL